ncbi:uncharacterized protein LOC114523886 isoform X2 [Dendronephthya gigantea]|nr:uncharacterized protein LOC114523886 isoform X2 [Dendronephthya gigantea]
MDASVSHGITRRASGLSPDVQRQQTFTFGMNKNQRIPSRDQTQVTHFAKLWQERLLARKTLSQKKFQARATFRKAIKKILSSLKVINAFLSCSSNTTSSHGRHDAVRYLMDVPDITGNHVPDEGRSARKDANSPTPLFDPAWFKANREIRLSSETKAILSQQPHTRTPEQIQTVFRSLQTLPSFAEYPLYHQKAICHEASFQSFPPNVTILQQGHRADNFYFVLFGSATAISKDDENDAENSNESVSVVKRGMAFGEAAIMTNSLRKVTVTSKTYIELLVVSKEDYAKIFLGADSDSGKKEYISFLRTVDFLRDWPVDILESYPEHSQHCYFRRGTVIVRNSNSSPWLYVVKSGVCEVLIRLNAVKPRKAIGRNVRELSSLEALTKTTMERRQEIRNRRIQDGEKHFTNLPNVNGKEKSSPIPSFRRKTLCFVPGLGLVNSQTISQRKSARSEVAPIAEDDVFPDFVNNDVKTTNSSKSSNTTISSLSNRRVSCQLPRISQSNSVVMTRRKSKTMPDFNQANDVSSISLGRTRSFSLPSTSIFSEKFSRLSKTKPAFVQIDLLHPKRVFGLSELDFKYNALDPGRPANVSLVSRGAECIMISKKFFIEHANALTKRWIRLNVQPYLPTEKHQQTLQEKTDWDAFKKKLVTSIVNENTKTSLSHSKRG